MLRLERSQKKAPLAIQLPKRSSFLDKALLQALVYSFIFHLVLFGTFKIRLNDYQEQLPQMLPLNVAIDTEKNEGLRFETEVVDIDQLDRSLFFISNLDEDEYKAMTLALSDQHSIAAFSNQTIHEMTPTLTWAPRMYPLKLKLSSKLKALTLLEDGSSLFRDRGLNESLDRFVLADKHLPTEYKVTVDGTTGLIMSAERKNVLLDKRLQACADAVINNICFKPFSEKSATGSITLVFCCTGDEIQGLMHD